MKKDAVSTAKGSLLRVVFDDEKVSMSRLFRGKERSLFVYRLYAWVVMENEGRHECVVWFQDGGIICTGGDLKFRRMFFSDDKHWDLEIEVDDGPLQPDNIKRFHFVAITDLGATVVSLYPGTANWAPPLTIWTSRNFSLVAHAEQLSAMWAMDATPILRQK